MKLSRIAPELRSSVRMMPPLPIKSALGRRFVRSTVQLITRDTHYADLRIEKQVTDDGVALRMYKPESTKTDAALLWIHGGGMVIGSAAQDDLFCVDTVRKLGVVIVSVEYRLAPEFPFPSAVDDCSAAWNWLQHAATHLHIDPTHVAVGGQSAGGGLAASLVQRIHDTEGVQPAAQWLFCPMLDDRTAARHELDEIKHKVWDNRLNRIGWHAFLGTEPGAETVPEYAVPARRIDLNGLPPTWIGTGDIELFFDEDKIYADRLNAAGVDCTLDIVPGAFHGFERLAAKTTLAQAYLSRSQEWLHRNLVVSPS